MYSQEKGVQEKYRQAFGSLEEQHINNKDTALAAEEIAELREMIGLLKKSMKDRMSEIQRNDLKTQVQIQTLTQENEDLRKASQVQQFHQELKDVKQQFRSMSPVAPAVNNSMNVVNNRSALILKRIDSNEKFDLEDEGFSSEESLETRMTTMSPTSPLKADQDNIVSL
tara:strand:+ start:315 stop:821 length:507 start_codon:yes stop_codon:yes gene_type:complete